MAVDHGSELHLLRFLGRHRQLLDAQVRDALSAAVGAIEWLDFPFDLSPKNPQGDGEWLSVDFLEDHGGSEWTTFWPDPAPGKPNRKGMPSWDAVGHAMIDGQNEWLLVEAKAHLGELRNPSAKCGAVGESLKKIKNALRETYQALTGAGEESWAPLESAWLGQDYQKANRLACLYFLNQIVHQPARLLYIYFIHDRVFPDAPTSKDGWTASIEGQYEALGLAKRGPDQVHSVFLDVRGPSSE